MSEGREVGARSQTIGRGTWLDKVAASVVARERELGRSLGLIRVESGLGASGIPHVGSFADAIRAFGIKLALQDAGYRSEFIAFADDLDGLRSVPAGLPDSLRRYIAFPVSVVPDPFDCHPSFGAHTSGMLREGLQRLGVEHQFQSGAEAYRSGLLNPQIRRILEQADVIGRKITEMLGQRKFEEVLPYFPICEQCGRIYVANAVDYVASEAKVRYRCSGTEIRGQAVAGCGHEGEVRITDGRGKLSWKAEFAARWAAQDIRFEAYGKDIADSVRVNDWIAAEILGFPPPHHVRYELFLDKAGRKISKSVGNVFTLDTWLRYGSARSLFLLMFKRIAGTRNLSVDDIPTYMDEYDQLEQAYFSAGTASPAKQRTLRGLYEYVNLLRPPQAPEPHVPYRLLVQLAAVAPEQAQAEYVLQRLRTYGLIRDGGEALKERVQLATNWATEFAAPRPVRVSLTASERAALTELARQVEDATDAQQLQTQIFEIARRHGLEPPQLFRRVYQMLLGAERGPRLGPYLMDLGPWKAAQALREQL
jgi:lysyl-tRNA synthetase class 1